MRQDESIHNRFADGDGILSEIIHHVGQDAAFELVRSFGGITLLIPHGKHVWPVEIEAAIGKAATERLVQAFKGCELYIPKRHKTLLQHRNVSICLEYEEEILRCSYGQAVNILARRHRLSDRSIWSILKSTDPAAVTTERQKRRATQAESVRRAPNGSVLVKIN